MKKVEKRKSKKKKSTEDSKSHMLKPNELVLIGVVFVGVCEFVVRHYGLTWRYLPYAFAVWAVLICRALTAIARRITKSASYFIDNI